MCALLPFCVRREIRLGTMDFLDWIIFLGGIAGFIGTLMGWKAFFNEDQMSTWIERYGRQRVRTVVAIVYLVLGLFGGYMALFL